MWLRRLIHWLRAALRPSAAVAQSASGLAAPAASNVFPAIYVPVASAKPLRQSEILTGIIQNRRSLRSLGAASPELEEIRHPYAVVVTQDCDLEQDHTARTDPAAQKNPNDKLIPSILLAEAVTVQELIASLPKGRDILKRVVHNKDERYHVFQKVEPAEDAQRQGLPALGVDFKRHFTVPTDELYAQISSSAKRRAHLTSPYLEHFGRRFADFLSRVALPKEHQVE